MISRAPPGRRTLTGLIVAVVVLTGWTANADAGTYQVSQCRLPNGASIGAPDVTGGFTAPYTYWAVDCSGPGAVMGISFEPTVWHAAGAAADLTFSAPAGTSIGAVSGNRVSHVSPGSSFRTPIARIEASTGDLEFCANPVSCDGKGTGTGVQSSNAFSFSGLQSSFVRFKIECSGGLDCAPEDPKATIQVFRAEFTLRDTNDPVAGTVSGPLVAAGVKTGSLG